jgi:hypothetical protein
MLPAQTPNVLPPQIGQATVTLVSRDTTDDAGDPIIYLSTPNPEVTSAIVSLPQGGKTDWMTHPAPGYLYVLEGELTVEFEDGHHLVFKAAKPSCRQERIGIAVSIRGQDRCVSWLSFSAARGYRMS